METYFKHLLSVKTFFYFKELSGKYDILIGPSLSNASEKTRTSVAGQTQEAGVHLISGLGCCHLFIYLFTLYFKLTYTVKNITVQIK